LGATSLPDGVNFSVFSRNASALELLLFDGAESSKPVQVIPIANRTYHYWHVFVPGLRPGQLYAYRAYGPSDPANGLRFDPSKVLLDPYGRGVVVPNNYRREDARVEGDNDAVAMKSVVVDPPIDITKWEKAPPVSGDVYRVGPRSVVVLSGRHEYLRRLACRVVGSAFIECPSGETHADAHRRRRIDRWILRWPPCPGRP
jgi:pullulanase/glycogen debranching enzyme